MSIRAYAGTAGEAALFPRYVLNAHGLRQEMSAMAFSYVDELAVLYCRNSGSIYKHGPAATVNEYFGRVARAGLADSMEVLLFSGSQITSELVEALNRGVHCTGSFGVWTAQLHARNAAIETASDERRARRQYGEESIVAISECLGEPVDPSAWTDEEITVWLGAQGQAWSPGEWAWLQAPTPSAASRACLATT